MSYAGTLNLTLPAANRVYQRDTRSGNPGGNWNAVYGRGWATVVLTLSPTATATLIEYRVRDSASITALLDWTTCATNVVAGSKQLALTLAARVGWSLIDLRANGDNTSIVSTSTIGAGEVIAATGQSLVTDFWGTVATGDTTTIAACGVLPSPYGTCLAAWDGAPAPASGAAWAAPSDGSTYSSSFCAEFLRLAVLGTGVNCALVGYGWSGEPVSSWSADGSGPKNAWAALTATLDGTVGQGGKIGTFIWCQGHNDARLPQSGVDGDELTADQYSAALSSVFSALAGRYSSFAFRRILSSIPAIGANWITTIPKFVPSYIEQVRAGQLRYLQTDTLTLGHVDGLDVGLWSDQTHPSQIGNVAFTRHFYRAFMHGVGTSPYAAGDSGPVLAGAGRRAAGANQIVLPIRHTGGTVLKCSGGPGGAASQFQVYRSGSTAAADQFTVASADLSQANVIVLTITPTPPDAQPLDVWYRLPPDNAAALSAANQIYDDNQAEHAIDGLATGRQLALFPGAIVVAAPSRHRPMLIAPGIPVSASFSVPAFVI